MIGWLPHANKLNVCIVCVATPLSDCILNIMKGKGCKKYKLKQEILCQTTTHNSAATTTIIIIFLGSPWVYGAEIRMTEYFPPSISSSFAVKHFDGNSTHQHKTRKAYTSHPPSLSPPHAKKKKRQLFWKVLHTPIRAAVTASVGECWYSGCWGRMRGTGVSLQVKWR